MMQDVEARIKRIIVEKLELGTKTKQLTSETPLIDGGLNMDSINVLELISLIEEEFGIVVGDEDMNIELLGNIGSLAAYVRTQMQQRPA
jgi:acyl carrier protein